MLLALALPWHFTSGIIVIRLSLDCPRISRFSPALRL